jgi:hypothetical protein
MICDRCCCNIYSCNIRYYAYDHKFCSEKCRIIWIAHYNEISKNYTYPIYHPEKVVYVASPYAKELTLREYINLPLEPKSNPEDLYRYPPSTGNCSFQ